MCEKCQEVIKKVVAVSQANIADSVRQVGALSKRELQLVIEANSRALLGCRLWDEGVEFSTSDEAEIMGVGLHFVNESAMELVDRYGFLGPSNIDEFREYCGAAFVPPKNKH